MFPYRREKGPANTIDAPPINEAAKKTGVPIGVSQAGASLIVTRAVEGGGSDDSATTHQTSVSTGVMSQIEGGKSANSLRKLVGTSTTPGPVEIPQQLAINNVNNEEEPKSNSESSSWIASWKSQPGKWFSRSEQPASSSSEGTAGAPAAATATPSATLKDATEDPGKVDSTIDTSKSLKGNSTQELKPETPSASTKASAEVSRENSTEPPFRGSWAFWSSNKGKSLGTDAELAVEGTTSESHPEHVTIDQDQEPARKQPRLETQSSLKAKATKPKRDHLLVPTFDTIPWQGKAQYIKSFLTRRRNTRLVRVSSSPPTRVVVVGVHGYFPARMTRAILGEPKGTSVKFANEAVAVVEKWFPEAEVEKIALEGEGKINHRISTLYNLILNWKESLRSADVVVFAAHSQGAVVSVQILRKLIQEGLIDLGHQKATLLAMAGTFLGPMPGMDKGVLMKAISRIENESLMELFELQTPQSPLGSELLASLDVILSHGVKMVLCGSADDQLVPLYSALCIHVSHPNIFRVAYLDGDDVAPDVVSPLLDLALRHKNRGDSDQNLIVELSGPLAGALTSKGHSKLYDFSDVYELAIHVAVETAAVISSSMQVSAFKIPKPNPFVLPWAAHALISTSEKSKQDSALVQQIHTEYSQWKPSSKPMKDLKFRLGALEASHSGGYHPSKL